MNTKINTDRKVVGIRNKDSGYVSGFSIVDDVACFINEMRSVVKEKPCAYNLFPDKYAFVVFSIGDEEAVIEFDDGHHE